ncbi:alpha/beta hydrolase [uncultured Gimesia sp.]|uniref:alpha/beta hydrolase n=1 Tax=uncultured Gimesia sp. TaxID=1678688 RepID=UPI00260FB358|nr:alpha/beta hydrolase [uncultured Gimesia sp.]
MDLIYTGKVTGALSQQLVATYADSLKDPIAAEQSDEFTKWKILYATNRLQEKNAAGETGYANEFGDTLAYGTGQVRISRKNHSDLKSKVIQTIWQGAPDPEGQVEISSLTPAEETLFFDDLNSMLEHSPQKDILVFVHGFNVNFPSAVTRAAQIANELPFNGAVICYSWPSQGGIEKYLLDGEAANASVEPMAQFLESLVNSVPKGTKINIMVHSMGNRVVMRAMNRLPDLYAQTKPFQNVVLAAPDVGVSEFKKLAPAIIAQSNRVTLYSGSGDVALVASKAVNQERRAGDSREPLIMEGVETIDVSAVDTSFMSHSYYGSNRAVLSDLFSLIKQDTAAANRKWLLSKNHLGMNYWAFDKEPPEIKKVRATSL